MKFKTIDDLKDANNLRTLVRVDINVPMDGDRVTDLTRIERIKPTVMELSRAMAQKSFFWRTLAGQRGMSFRACH